MPWQVKKSRRPADHIPEMFMPRKAFDNELRHEKLICREAKVICYCLPPPRLMSQEPRCQMHRLTGATVDRFFFFPLSRFSCFRSRAFLARFSTKSYFLIAICRKRFCILAFIRTLFRMKPETPNPSAAHCQIKNIFKYISVFYKL